VRRASARLASVEIQISSDDSSNVDDDDEEEREEEDANSARAAGCPTRGAVIRRGVWPEHLNPSARRHNLPHI
jgi:hypothetical protein